MLSLGDCGLCLIGLIRIGHYASETTTNNRDKDEVKDFVNSLKTMTSMNMYMYPSSIKMYVRCGKELDKV